MPAYSQDFGLEDTLIFRSWMQKILKSCGDFKNVSCVKDELKAYCILENRPRLIKARNKACQWHEELSHNADHKKMLVMFGSYVAEDIDDICDPILALIF